MKILNALGVILPLFVIIIVTLLGILDIGLTVEEYSPISIPRENLFFYDDQSTHNREPFILRTIVVGNDFILERRVPIQYIACTKGSQYSSRVYLSMRIDGEEGSYNEIYGNSWYVDVAPGKTRTVELVTQPTYSYLRSDEQNTTTHIVLFKNVGKTMMYDCQQLISEEGGRGIKIPIVGQ